MVRVPSRDTLLTAAAAVIRVETVGPAVGWHVRALGGLPPLQPPPPPADDQTHCERRLRRWLASLAEDWHCGSGTAEYDRYKLVEVVSCMPHPVEHSGEVCCSI